MRISPSRLVLVLFVAALPASAGSIWPTDGASLFADNKAYKVGDILTITVDENAETSNTAGNALSKKSSADGSIDTLVVPMGPMGTTKFFTQTTPAAKWSSTRTFTGSGSHTVQGTVKTSIAAVVKEVLPNGNLMIEGKRVRQSAGETIIFTISGIARPQDITTSNTIASTSLAQARMILETTGPVARSTRRGWFDRIMDIIWPF